MSESIVHTGEMESLSNNPYTDKFFPNSRQIWRICVNLKKLIDGIISIEFDESQVTHPNSAILNINVLELVYKAAGGKGDGKPDTSSFRYRASLPFCLLKVCGWYWQQAELELYDTQLHKLRATAAQILAANIIEETKDDEYLFLAMLCHRYVLNANDEDSHPLNVLELSVDMHSTTVISSAGYQRCIKWLWRGWIIQSEHDPYSYDLYKGAASHKVRTHFDPSRIKTPRYQNILEIFFSFFYLFFFTIVLNTHDISSPVDICEIIFYLFTISYILDEFIKFYHIGHSYFGFWNAFNDIMYSLICIAVGFRMTSVSTKNDTVRARYDELSFRVLSCVAPFMWSRLLLFLDAQKFVGAMIVVIKTMMKESIIFFVLLFVIIVGFLQGFLGLDAADGKSDATKKIFIILLKTVIGGSGFEDMADLVPPYASILYSAYSFCLTVILMNILVALYSTAYGNIVENAIDEYFALVAQKTLRYIRAPDQDLYVPPLNLLELLMTPITMFLPRSTTRIINYFIMLIIYSPLLVYVTAYELSNAKRISYNRFKGFPDDANEADTEWDLTDGYSDTAATAWEGIQEMNAQVNEAVQQQRSAEIQDPEFRIDQGQFEKEINAVAKPVFEANRHGVKWEYFEIYQKIDKLTALVETVVKENEELKKR